MNRREFLRRSVLLSLSLPFFSACSFWEREESKAQGAACKRIVVLSDSHLPVRKQHHKTAEKQAEILRIKQTVREDINGWPDVALIAVTGDLAARWALPEEVAYAKEYFSAFKAPVKVVAGNHDYIYTGEQDKKGRSLWADREGRRWRLAKFCRDWGLSSPSYSLKLDDYRLVFLSPEELEAKLVVSFSQNQLVWLEKELSEYRTEPTIIFFHAPLFGTLETYSKSINTPQMTAQPQAEIKALLRKNPQVFLWVSGHTHTNPKKTRTFADPAVNLYDGRVMNIHCDTMDRRRNLSQSLYLYPDRVEIKTYDHMDQKWREELFRTVKRPEKL